jgi:hypothetical protein
MKDRASPTNAQIGGVKDQVENYVNGRSKI